MKTLLVLIAAAALAGAAPAGRTSTGSRGRSRPISPALAKRMTGVSWRPGCPVPLRDLRVVRATHHGFDGRDHAGA